jgi:hypothetical protein
MGRGKFKGKPTGQRHFSTPEQMRKIVFFFFFFKKKLQLDLDYYLTIYKVVAFCLFFILVKIKVFFYLFVIFDLLQLLAPQPVLARLSGYVSRLIPALISNCVFYVIVLVKLILCVRENLYLKCSGGS